MSDFRSLLSSFQDATGSSASSNVRTSSTSATNKKRPQQQQESLSKKNKTAQKEDIDRLWRTSQIKTSFAASSSSSSKKVTQKESTTKIDDTRGSGPLCGAGASTTTTPAIHVAICATIVSELPHEEIWRTWSSHHPENDSTSASIHVHAKTPSLIPNNSWLKSRLIPISHNPNWNDYRIILAMLSLAEYAIKEQPNTTHIMMVTESCIPIGSLDELTNIIIKEGSVSADGGLLLDQSFLDVYGIDSSRCTRFDEHACFSINDIPKDAIYKALPGWALFSRSHMEEMMNIKDRFNGGGELYPLFKSVWAPEEVYFPTALALLGKLSGNDQVVRRSLMWSKWDANIKGKDRAHPIVYDGQFCKKIVDDVKAEGCIFMRKWKKRLNYRQWESIVLNNTSTSIREANKQNNASKRSREESESGNNTTSMISKRQKSSVSNGGT